MNGGPPITTTISPNDVGGDPPPEASSGPSLQNEKQDLKNQLWILKEVDLPRCQEELKKYKEKLEKAEKEIEELRNEECSCLNSIKKILKY